MSSKNAHPAGVSRRALIKKGAALGALVGIYAFPPGRDVVTVLASGARQLTRTYPPLALGAVASLTEGQPVDFEYPLSAQSNFLLKLGAPAWSGVGPDRDIVAFSYSCSHMGCPLNGTYTHEHKVLGPCPCHLSQFDLTKGGRLVIGQATQALPQILLRVFGAEIYALGVRGVLYGHADNLLGRARVTRG